MDLILDIGNTRVKAAEFMNEGIHKLHVFEHHDQAALKTVLGLNPNRIIISSNSGSSLILPQSWLNKPVIFFDDKTKLPITNTYTTPETLGKDRLAAAVGAHFLWPNENMLIIDCGTCITADIIDATGAFLGGSISPGLQMRLKAMHQLTGALPLVEMDLLTNSIGYNTKTSLQSGAYYGIIHELNGQIAHYGQLFDDLKVVICGGDASYFVNRLKKKIFANQNLVLIGLNQILKYND